MNKVCLKSKWLAAIIILVIILAMGAGGCNSNGRYQMTCIQDGNIPRAFVIDTQTGEVRDLDIHNNTARYQSNSTSGPWK